MQITVMNGSHGKRPNKWESLSLSDILAVKAFCVSAVKCFWHSLLLQKLPWHFLYKCNIHCCVCSPVYYFYTWNLMFIWSFSVTKQSINIFKSLGFFRMGNWVYNDVSSGILVCLRHERWRSVDTNAYPLYPWLSFKCCADTVQNLKMLLHNFR